MNRNQELSCEKRFFSQNHIELAKIPLDLEIFQGMIEQILDSTVIGSARRTYCDVQNLLIFLCSCNMESILQASNWPRYIRSPGNGAKILPNDLKPGQLTMVPSPRPLHEPRNNKTQLTHSEQYVLLKLAYLRD
jgi:hypothetical protein